MLFEFEERWDAWLWREGVDTVGMRSWHWLSGHIGKGRA